MAWRGLGHADSRGMTNPLQIAPAVFGNCSLRLLELRPYDFDDLLGWHSGRQKAAIAAILADEIDEAGVIYRVVAVLRRAGTCEVDLVGESNFSDGGMR